MVPLGQRCCDRVRAGEAHLDNRRMLPEEKSLIVGELERGEDALSDLIWALLNTPEFLFVK